MAVQFMEVDTIAMFELVFQDNDLRIVDEKHYKLVPARDIGEDDLETMTEMRG